MNSTERPDRIEGHATATPPAGTTIAEADRRIAEATPTSKDTPR